MKQINKLTPLTNHEISVFSNQMSMMLSAGITIDEALRLLEQDADTTEGKLLIHEIYDILETGTSLNHAIKESGLFPKYVVDMVTIGEQTGKLDTVFASLADYYDREEAIADSIRQAVTYPFIMIIMMLCVITVLIAKVLPSFKQVYEQLGSSVSGVSATILGVGDALGKYSAVFIIIFALLVGLYVYFTRTAAGRVVFQNLAAHLPIMGDMYDKIAAGRFSSGMALALGSGFTAMEAVIMVEQLITNKVYSKKITRLKALMDEGDLFSDAAVKAGIFSGTYGRMVSIGFKSGMLDSVMNRVAQRYELEVDRAIGHFVSILEPTLVAILSVIVGLILLSVMLPLMGIMSQIG